MSFLDGNDLAGRELSFRTCGITTISRIVGLTALPQHSYTSFKVHSSNCLISMTISILVERDGFYEVNGIRQEPAVSLYVQPAASKLRRMIKDTNELIVCPGVYDGLSARVAMELGFKAMYMVSWTSLHLEFH